MIIITMKIKVIIIITGTNNKNRNKNNNSDNWDNLPPFQEIMMDKPNNRRTCGVIRNLHFQKKNNWGKEAGKLREINTC